MPSSILTVPAVTCLQCLHSPFHRPFFCSLNSLVAVFPSCSSEAVKASPVFTRRARTVVTKSEALAAQERWLIRIQPVNHLIYWLQMFTRWLLSGWSLGSMAPTTLPLLSLLTRAMALLHLLTKVVNSDISFNSWGERGTRSAVSDQVCLREVTRQRAAEGWAASGALLKPTVARSLRDTAVACQATEHTFLNVLLRITQLLREGSYFQLYNLSQGCVKLAGTNACSI